MFLADTLLEHYFLNLFSDWASGKAMERCVILPKYARASMNRRVVSGGVGGHTPRFKFVPLSDPFLDPFLLKASHCSTDV